MQTPLQSFTNNVMDRILSCTLTLTWIWRKLNFFKWDSHFISQTYLGYYQLLEGKLDIRRPINSKPRLQPRGNILNIQGNKLVGSYGDHLSLLACDHYLWIILDKPNYACRKPNLTMVTHSCRRRSWISNAHSHLKGDLAPQVHKLNCRLIWLSSNCRLI